MSAASDDALAFVTRAEFRAVENDVTALRRDFHTLAIQGSANQTLLTDISRQLTALTIATSENGGSIKRLGSVRSWVGWGIVTAMSAAVGAFLTHIPMTHP